MMASGEIRLSATMMRRMPVLAQSQKHLTACQQATALSNALSPSPGGNGETSPLEAAGLGVGTLGSSGDLLADAAPGANLGSAGKFFGSVGQSLSRSALFAGTALSAGSALYSAGTGNYADAAFTSFDVGVDLTLSRFGLYGGLAALTYDASGGSKNYVAAATLSTMYNALNTLNKACALGF